MALSWHLLLLVASVGAAVQCPDGTKCSGKTLCCELPGGNGYGCCPEDEDINRNVLTIPWYKKMPALKYGDGNFKCDDSSFCPEKSSCCQLPTGEWGCCPFEQAVPCSDDLHCCPSGYTCDASSGSCRKTPEETSQPASTIQPVGVVWCNSTHYCSDGQSCCSGYYGAWICCPYTRGVCCPDKLHCCPYGHVCLNSGTFCSRSGNPRWDLGYEENTLL